MSEDPIPVTPTRRGVRDFPAKFPEDSVVIRIDTREKQQWTFDSVSIPVTTSAPPHGGHPFGGVKTVVDTLKFGDYALHADPYLACVERKSLADFAKSVTAERERFLKMCHGLAGSTERPLVIVEADYGMIELGSGWRGRVTPEQVLAGLHTVQTIVPVLLCRSRGEAERACYRHIRLAAKARYGHCREYARFLDQHRDQ